LALPWWAAEALLELVFVPAPPHAAPASASPSASAMAVVARERMPASVANQRVYPA
jgi:hypothetical protein